MNIFGLRKKLSILLLAVIIVTGVNAQDIVSFSNLSQYGINTGNRVSLKVNARGSQVISYGVASSVGGVLFQETAVPATGFAGMSVSLEYTAEKPDGQRLAVTIGNTTVTADLYDWQFIPTALFAESEYTACMTLLGQPKTRAEIITDINNEGRVMWMEFHPSFTNTLAGINLFFIDALLIDFNRSPLRQVTSALNGVIPGYNDISFNAANSASSSSFIRGILFDSTHEWESYIYTDYGTSILYEIKDGRLVFTGHPSYLFLSFDDDTETVIVNDTLNNLMKREIQNIRNINPVIYRAAEQTAQWAAFFRMVKEQNPQAWSGFISRIQGASFESHISTPRYWFRH